MTYGNTTYNFVVDYFGGSGNDLVLQWINNRVLGWGDNGNGQLGNGATTNTTTPVAVDASGVLAGRVVVALSDSSNTFSGSGHSLALCSDRTFVAWGDNYYSQLGINSTSDVSVPTAVVMAGELAGKSVVAMCTGSMHNLLLCSDGSLVTWAKNDDGQLGIGSTSGTSVPVAVVQSGVLAGKVVTGVAAGFSHNLVRCSDGTMAAWGWNAAGQLGDGSSTSRSVPVMVDATGVLAGKAAVAIACGQAHSLALCSDGTLAAWGSNSYGQLGNGKDYGSESKPVLVNQTGVLAGKTVAAIAAGRAHSLALCTDGTLVAWGSNANGQLGNNTTTNSTLPLRVDSTGVLANKVVVGISAGDSHSLAWCSDGSLVVWGDNYYGQLGINSLVDSLVPVAVNTSLLLPGERFMMAKAGSTSRFSLALVASPLQSTTPLPASAITGLSATLNGTINANGNATTVAFEYGLSAAYDHVIAGNPLNGAGASATAVSAAIGGLTPGTLYHYRVVGSSRSGIARSEAMTFTTLSDNAKLAALGMSAGSLVPEFDKLTMSYISTVPFANDGVTVTPVTDHPGAVVIAGGDPVSSGSASGVNALAVGNNIIPVFVTAEDGITTKTYTITVTRLPLNFTFNSASDVPVSADGFSAGDVPVDIVLNYTPTPGTILTMVKNAGLGFIHGRFGNLAQGQRVSLVFGGKTYGFVPNYFGGSGNDLVLQWAATEVVAWGSNSAGQLGDSTTARRLRPTAVDATGVLGNKTIIAVAEGYLHSLALCSDGTLAAWGHNVYGQLGNQSAVASNVPVAVDRSGALADKSVIAISAGPFHNLALCSDGTVVAWGYNNYGQLGTGDTVTNRVPVAVNPIGALAGKNVVAVAAAAYSSFALCDDGSLAAWGYNDEGELGDGTTNTSSVPVAVAIPSGKLVASLAAGQYHTLALCSDDSLFAWGYNNRGQLGNASTLSSISPVAIGASGTLAGKTVISVRASGAHSLALCADGSLAAWGWNNNSQLGLTGVSQSTVPTVVALAAGANQIAIGGSDSLAWLADGTLAAWGDNAYGQLGNNTMTPSAVPVSVDPSGLAVGARWMEVASGSAAMHRVAVVGLPVVGLAPNAVLSDADLIGYAFGLQAGPDGGGGQLPQGRIIGSDYVIEFTQPAGVTGITYGAEFSPSLLPGSWVDVPDRGIGGQHIFSVPTAVNGKMFLRLKVVRQ